MKKSTKIIIIISCISILSMLFIIPSFAIDYPNELSLSIDDKITFNDNVNFNAVIGSSGGTLTFSYKVKDNTNDNYLNCNSIYIAYYGVDNNANRISYKYAGNSSLNAYTSNSWNNDELYDYKNIIITANINITDEKTIKFLYDNAVIAPWINPMYDNSDNFLTASLGYINTITNYITTNTVIIIFSIGFIVVSLTIGIISRLNRKKFK